MSKRYWTTVKIEVWEYDEATKSVSHRGGYNTTSSQLTPEPDKFIKEVLTGKAEALAKFYVSEVDERSDEDA